MTNWFDYGNFAIAIGGFIAALLGLLVALSAAYIKHWDRRYLCAIFSVLVAYVASDLVAFISMVFLGPSFAWLSKASVFCEMCFSITLVPLVIAYLLACAGKSLRDNMLMRCVLVLWAAYLVLLVVAQFSDGLYTFSADGHRVEAGTLFSLLFVLAILLFLMGLLALYCNRDALTYRQVIAFAIYLILPLVCIFLQAAFFDLHIIVLGTCIASLVLLSFLLANLVEAQIKQREDAALQHAQVIALQMRPHFIYNVMSSIYYLCVQDPARAQKVTLDFTNYLRANYDAVAQEGKVPFMKELEHTRAYLAVESARLEDSLLVEIDCPFTSFRIPPLTLQPLVENAVKYGADPELPPLHVRVTTHEEDGFTVITVEDSGPGFDNRAPEDYSSGAISNIKERLAACNSTLEIGPREGGGTVATVRVAH